MPTNQISKRLDRLERSIPPPRAGAVDPEEQAQRLAAWLRLEYADCQAAGYLDPNGELTPACPLERRSAALLAGLLVGGELCQTR